MKHARQELDRRWLIGILFVESKEQFERSIFEWSIGCLMVSSLRTMQRLLCRTWTKDNCVPKHDIVSAWRARDTFRWIR
jgi:hypothetical protein